jgi:hypothetical protein
MRNDASLAASFAEDASRIRRNPDIFAHLASEMLPILDRWAEKSVSWVNHCRSPCSAFCVVGKPDKVAARS